MARIYLKPQVRSSSSSNSSRPLSARPSRSLDYNVIEQIANGIEKMVVQWNHAKEARIIRPYTSSSSSSSSRNLTAPGGHFSSSKAATSRAAAGAAGATVKQSDESVQAGSPQVGESSASAASTSNAAAEGPTEMSIFLRSPGSLEKMMIPNFSGIVSAEMVKQCQEQLSSDHHVINSSWYLKTNAATSAAASNAQESGFDNGCCSARTTTDQESGQMISASDDDFGSIEITPRLESALERIQELNNSSSSTANAVSLQEVTKQQLVVSSSLQELSSLEVPAQKAAILQSVEIEGEKDGVMIGSEEVERTESAGKAYSEGSLDDASLPQVSNNQVDDWTDTSEIVGDENIRELISYSKKKETIKGKEELLDDYKVKIEELQIALLECSTEYEVKIVEMKMMMLNMKSQYRQQLTTSGNGNLKAFEPQTKSFSLVTSSQAKQNVEFLKKQMQKLKCDKENLSRELFNLKKKQRQSEKQKKSLDDALNKVSCLRRELAKRDEEILDSHLREKEQRAQLNELHHALQSARAAQAEPGKLLALLPVLRNWLKSVKKGQYYHEPNLMSNVENFLHPQALMRKPPVKAPLTTSDYTKENRQNPRVERIVGSVTKEIQALQKALEKLACGSRGGSSSTCHQTKDFQRVFGSYAAC